MIWFRFSPDHSGLLRIDYKSKDWSQQDHLETFVVIDMGYAEDLDQGGRKGEMEGFSKYVGGRVDGTSW